MSGDTEGGDAAAALGPVRGRGQTLLEAEMFVGVQGLGPQIVRVDEKTGEELFRLPPACGVVRTRAGQVLWLRAASRPDGKGLWLGAVAAVLRPTETFGKDPLKNLGRGRSPGPKVPAEGIAKEGSRDAASPPPGKAVMRNAGNRWFEWLPHRLDPLGHPDPRIVQLTALGIERYDWAGVQPGEGLCRTEAPPGGEEPSLVRVVLDPLLDRTAMNWFREALALMGSLVTVPPGGGRDRAP